MLLVQGAKLMHRMASNSHKRRERIGYDGKVRVEALHKYTLSRGRVLVYIDQQLDKVAELTVAG